MTPVIEKNLERWMSSEYDEETRQEIEKLRKENPEGLLDAFYQEMSFGTGGLRGRMGVGPNRMNVYTVRAATQGLANYILKQRVESKVFIGFDCRRYSRTFAEEVAKVMAGNGIGSYLCIDLRPLPIISFGVRHCHCIAGIMITASHNPPDYNGYKVFWSTGGQILPPHDQAILEEIKKINGPSSVKMAPFPHPLITEVGREIDEAYMEAIDRCPFHPHENRASGHTLNVVYTSLHGCGITMIPQTLNRWGFTQVTLVEEQAQPDGFFPTVESPNPEDHGALALGLKRLQDCGGDILLGTDPDTDRIGLVAMHHGNPFFFDGQQVACLLLEYICRSSHLIPQHACVKTIVTTELFAAIARYHGIPCFDVLTGFKYIGAKIDEWEEGPYTLLLGAEESYGYLVGDHVRDKDAIVTAATLCEAALLMKRQGKTLVDLLYDIYLTHGIYREKLLSLTFDGKEGAATIHAIMEKLRSFPSATLCGLKIMASIDYLTHPDFPRSNVLSFELEEGIKIVLRPSGTEPKIKIYSAISGPKPQNRGAIKSALDASDQLLDTLLTDFAEALIVVT